MSKPDARAGTMPRRFRVAQTTYHPLQRYQGQIGELVGIAHSSLQSSLDALTLAMPDGERATFSRYELEATHE